MEGKIEEARRYAEFMAYWMGGPNLDEPKEALEKYYADMPEKVKALGDSQFTAMNEEMGKLAEGMSAKGATMKEVMLATMAPGKRMGAYLADKIVEALK